MSALQRQSGQSGCNVITMFLLIFLLQTLVCMVDRRQETVETTPHCLATLFQTTGGTEGSPLEPELSLLAGQAVQAHHRAVKRSPEAEPGAGGNGVVTFSVTASLDTLRQKLLWSLQNNNRNVTGPRVCATDQK